LRAARDVTRLLTKCPTPLPACLGTAVGSSLGAHPRALLLGKCPQQPGQLRLLLTPLGLLGLTRRLRPSRGGHGQRAMRVLQDRAAAVAVRVHRRCEAEQRTQPGPQRRPAPRPRRPRSLLVVAPPHHPCYPYPPVLHAACVSSSRSPRPVVPPPRGGAALHWPLLGLPPVSPPPHTRQGALVECGGGDGEHGVCVLAV
jgi:hypothetical protein